MAEDTTQRFQQLLGSLFGAISAHDPTVLAKIEGLLLKIPEEPNLLHLAGLACADQNRLDEAARYLLSSLERVANQPEVHNNLGNVYAKLDNTELAAKHYREAMALRVDFQDAKKNLGLVLIDSDPNAAIAALQSALALKPEDVGALTGLGDAYRALEKHDEAGELYARALAINPNHVNARHNLALSQKQNDQLPAAVENYKLALALASTNAEIHYNYANALFESGDHTRAEDEYLRSIEQDPGFVLAHETLHEFYWQTGQHERLESSYLQSLARAPRDTALRLSYIKMLSACGREERAQSQIDEALAIETTPALLHAKGRLAANRQDYEGARGAFSKALGRLYDAAIAQDLARLQILQADYAGAQREIDRLLAFAPNDQLSWALQALNWRLTGDERYRWLIDYQEHIGVFTLPTPAGYRSLDEFLEELEAVLLGMHTARCEPSQQTLKLGTQTPGRLLLKRHPVIAHYRAALTSVVEQYLSRFSRDESHPFLRRLPSPVHDRFFFSGSWSVKLKPKGFHVNHVHPEGWISSASYISLPRALRGTDEVAGCIKFGESALMLNDREVVERVIRPEAGQLVLFPSYTWHGTYAFDGEPEEFRLTAPFDVLPIE